MFLENSAYDFEVIPSQVCLVRQDIGSLYMFVTTT